MRALAVGTAAVVGAAMIVAPTTVPAAPTAQSQPVRVAVIDSGVQRDLLPGISTWTCGRRCVRGQSPPATNHGTLVTALIRTLVPTATITSYRVVDRTGNVNPVGMRSALRHIQRRGGTEIVNVSLSTYRPDPHLHRIIRRMPGTVVVTAAGNDGRKITGADPVMPCMVRTPHTLCVAASTSSAQLAPYSSWSPRFVDLAADGSVHVPPPVDTTASGTSFAAPQVTAAIANVLQRHPRLTAAAARSRVLGAVRRSPALVGAVASGGVLRSNADRFH